MICRPSYVCSHFKYNHARVVLVSRLLLIIKYIIFVSILISNSSITFRPGRRSTQDAHDLNEGLEDWIIWVFPQTLLFKLFKLEVNVLSFLFLKMFCHIIFCFFIDLRKMKNRVHHLQFYFLLLNKKFLIQHKSSCIMLFLALLTSL